MIKIVTEQEKQEELERLAEQAIEKVDHETQFSTWSKSQYQQDTEYICEKLCTKKNANLLLKILLKLRSKVATFRSRYDSNWLSWLREMIFRYYVKISKFLTDEDKSDFLNWCQTHNNHVQYKQFTQLFPEEAKELIFEQNFNLVNLRLILQQLDREDYFEDKPDLLDRVANQIKKRTVDYYGNTKWQFTNEATVKAFHSKGIDVPNALKFKKAIKSSVLETLEDSYSSLMQLSKLDTENLDIARIVMKKMIEDEQYDKVSAFLIKFNYLLVQDVVAGNWFSEILSKCSNPIELIEATYSYSFTEGKKHEIIKFLLGHIERVKNDSNSI